MVYGEPLDDIDIRAQSVGPAQQRTDDGAASADRSRWHRLEITAVPAGNGQNVPPDATTARLSWQSSPRGPHLPSGLVQNEFGIGFNDQGALGGFVRLRSALLRGADSSASARDSHAMPFDPAALASHRAHPGAPCCLPELGPPTLFGEAAPMVSFIARLRRGLHLNLADVWKFNAGVQTREYSTTLSSRMAHLTVERYWGSVHTSYSFRLERPNGWSLAPSHLLSFDYLLDPVSTVGLSLTTGREMAFFGSLGALNTEVRGLAFHSEHSVKKDWSFSFNAGYFDHGTMPAQKIIRFSVSHSL